ncbi:chemical-damaging agent resistance protein C [Bacillus sp. M6-12]|uniref:TerD family protein n=1 Tax=Bacillus sp. M6-12 TaxID=2054166 RepID=UPI000C77EF54|nr:TerD family protein [Bacillus sp. M6-12]PLS19467.1 chemical-damaging agent resistance protein C [Bacillus sp. M6-12]
MGIELGGTQQPATQLGGGIQLGRQPQAPAPTPAPAVGGGLSLQKGAKMDLTKGNPGLDNILVALGWDVNASGGQQFDLDVEVFQLGADGQVINKTLENVIFYNNPISKDGAIKHNGDNRTGQGEGDDETISIKLSQLSPEVQKLVFAVSIDQAFARQQNFGQVNNAYIRIVNEATGQELYRYDLTEDYSTSISVEAGEVYRHSGEFKFGATGNGSTSDLAGLCGKFGINL